MSVPPSMTISAIEMTEGGIALMIIWRGAVVFHEVVDNWAAAALTIHHYATEHGRP
ncbi:hypothetical protein [Parvibaculum sp.]|uniref:hypothetical protein n=1 Tax=Parvibaculum sp. TaxID=2024848 RepID=UPI001E16C904|nr:hypothetical protein [Parvibaculum sp.]MBX3487866.1 hypothetical protein [Parvibaculum sp.]